MKLSNVGAFQSNEYYGLYTRVNDQGSITIASWWFIIEPSTSGENWAIICFLYSSSGSGWALLDQGSVGNSQLINTTASVWNDIYWTIESDKTVIVKVGNQILYQTDEISNLENQFGFTITMDLTTVGNRTFYNREVKFDDVILKTPTGPMKPKTEGEHIREISSSSRDMEIMAPPKDFSNLKTLREFLTEIK